MGENVIPSGAIPDVGMFARSSILTSVGLHTRMPTLDVCDGNKRHSCVVKCSTWLRNMQLQNGVFG